MFVKISSFVAPTRSFFLNGDGSAQLIELFVVQQTGLQETKEQGNISEISDSRVKICEAIKSVRNSLALSVNAVSGIYPLDTQCLYIDAPVVAPVNSPIAIIMQLQN